MIDSQVTNLNRRKRDLLEIVNTWSGFAEKSIRQFCASARTKFEQANDLESKHQFLCEHIEKITFTRGRFSIFGSVPTENTSDESLPFRIEGEIDSVRSRIKVGRKALQV